MKNQMLVVGCGGVGERHLRCLQKTNRAEVSVCDLNPGVLERVQRQYHVIGYDTLEAALAAKAYDGVIISTPAPTHVTLALASMGCDRGLLVEKPLSTTLEGVAALKQEAERRRKLVAVAYVQHFRRNVREVRQLLRRGSLGKALQVAVVSGQNFPEYRPGYKNMYYARREMGGGAIQDSLSHLVNVVELLVGPTTRVYCDAAHKVLEGVIVEDTVGVSARNGDVFCTYSLNQFQSPDETTIHIHCERGSVKIEFHLDLWSVWRRGAVDWELFYTPENNPDEIYVAQANAFVDALSGEQAELCTLEEGLRTLKFNLAAIKSAQTGQAVTID